MDAFFASVEQRDNPALQGKPVVVGGMHRGVVAAASYEARRFGIHSAMPMRAALARCPHLQVIAPRRSAYAAASAQAFAIFARYTPLIEPLSLDEAFLDVTGSRALFGEGAAIAARIRQNIRQELCLPSSAGVACNKFIAKIACDLAKPQGLHVVAPGSEQVFLRPLPIEKVFGVGAVAAARLHRAGIHCLGDAARAEPSRLQAFLGPLGARIHHLAQGIDPRPVVADAARKSISSESTLDEDVFDAQALRRELLQHALIVASRLSAAKVYALGVHIKLKDAQFQVETRQQALDPGTQDPDALYQAGVGLLAKIRTSGRAFRLCGLGAHSLRPGEPPRQLFEDADVVRRRHVEAARLKIAQKFGAHALTRASLMGPDAPKRD
jgi:DNA polymerase-4